MNSSRFIRPILRRPRPYLATKTTRNRKIGRWILQGVATFAVVAAGSLAFLSWYFTAPLEEMSAAQVTTPTEEKPSVDLDAYPTWPKERLEGIKAKTHLLIVLEAVEKRMSAVQGYTATLKKQERIGGKLGPEQTMFIKVRNQPFAFYGKFLAPKKGKEVIFAEGHHDNNLIGHNGDWTRKLIPRLSVPPDGPIALKDSRHPVTEAGLLFLTRRLLGFRKLDFEDPEATSELDWAEGLDGTLWPRSIHTHPHPQPGRPFARIEVLYEPETLIPRYIVNYDWPDDGRPAIDRADLPLAERYMYLDLNFDVELSDHDFDPANPEYEFHRF